MNWKFEFFSFFEHLKRFAFWTTLPCRQNIQDGFNLIKWTKAKKMGKKDQKENFFIFTDLLAAGWCLFACVYNLSFSVKSFINYILFSCLVQLIMGKNWIFLWWEFFFVKSIIFIFGSCENESGIFLFCRMVFVMEKGFS